MQWEYRIERLKPEKDWGADEKIEPLQECLDKMGRDRWELINVSHDEGPPYVLFFKRPRI